MKSSRWITVVIVPFLCASASFAQLARSAVSINGLDTNPCTVPSPCRSFAQAISQTNSGGEMIALDSAGYGPFTIDRPISVQAAPGVYAGITASSGTAIAVTPGQFAGPVLIRGLFVNGTGGSTGIDLSNVFEVTIDKCTVLNFATGISITTNGIFTVTDTLVNGGGIGSGMVIGASVGTPEITLDNIRLINSNLGLVINNAASAVMHRSVVAQNGSGNIQVVTTTNAYLTVSDSLVTGYNKNGEAIRAQAAGAHVTVTRSTLADCATAMMNVSGTFLSTGDNTISNCTTPTGGTITPLTTY